MADNARFCGECGANLQEQGTEQQHAASQSEADGGTDVGRNQLGTATTSTSTESTGTGMLSGESSRSFNVATGGKTKLIYAGAVLTALGAFLPWATFLGQTIIGIEGDGVLTLLFAITAAGVTAWKGWTKRVCQATIALGILIVFIALFALTNLAGAGIYATILGGVVIAAPGIREYI